MNQSHKRDKHIFIICSSLTGTLLRTALFWVLTRRLVVISYRRFRTKHRFHLKGSRTQKKTMRIRPIGYPETSVRNYHQLPRKNPEELSSRLLRGGSLKSRPTHACCHAAPVRVCVSRIQADAICTTISLQASSGSRLIHVYSTTSNGGKNCCFLFSENLLFTSYNSSPRDMSLFSVLFLIANQINWKDVM